MIIEKIVYVIGRGYALCTTLGDGESMPKERDVVSINNDLYRVTRVEGFVVTPIGDKGIVCRKITIFVDVDDETAKTFKENDEIIIYAQ